MINTIEKAYELVEERGESMYSFCKQHLLPYNTINVHRLRKSELHVSTIYAICDALGITASKFFEEEEKEGQQPPE